MNSISASFMSLISNGNNGQPASNAGSGAANTAFDELLSMSELSSSPTTGSQTSSMASLFSIGGSSASAGFASMGSSFSQMLSILQEIDPSMQSASTSQSSLAAQGYSADAIQLMGAPGPLPTWLDALNNSGVLSSSQDVSVWNIAAENLNDPQTMTPQQITQQISSELAQDGVPQKITIPG